MTDPRAALEAIGQLPDSEIDIAEAALQLGRVDAPKADWAAAQLHLSELARATVAASLHGKGDMYAPARRADILAGILAETHGYRGDVQDYDNLANANLLHCIERRCGLPVAIGILWLHCAHAAGWAAHGVDFPGHFLVALPGRGTQVVVDVFHAGAQLDTAALRALIKRVEGDGAELRPGMLRPMGTRAVLLRLQNNIRSRRLAGGDLPGALAAVQDMLHIAPDAATLWRDAARLHHRLDQVAAALRAYERFVALTPRGADVDRAQAAIDELRARLN